MSIIVKSTGVIIAVLMAAYIVGQFTTKSVETTIEIDASPAQVWTVLSDTQAYGDWNPLVRSIDGELAVGQTLTTSIQLGDRTPMGFTPTVLVASPDEELRWLGHMGLPGIFDGEHYFIVEETENGTTLFRHGEKFSGMLMYLLLFFIGEETEVGFHAMNAALKAHVEEEPA